VAGGFVYFNRNLLFKPATPTPAPPVKVPEVPPAPAGLTVVAPTPNSVSLAWRDVSQLETGYRLERREQGGTYLPLTNLPANSTAFLDTSVQPGTSYQYLVFASNATGESPASNEAGITVPAAPVVAPPAPAAPVLPPGGLDSDSDGLSDTEEALFGTDPNNPDSDGDHFNDGNEVFHLYDPTQTTPAMLKDSALVKIFAAPAGWELLVPSAWNTRLDQPDGSAATLDTLHGETFQIAIYDNAAHATLADWYAANFPSAAGTALNAAGTAPNTFRTKKGLDGLTGANRLETYFAWDGKVFGFKYILDGQQFVNYRTTFEMMLNSLRLKGVPQVANPAEMLLGPGGYVGPLVSATSTALNAVASTSTVTTSTELTLPAVTSTALNAATATTTAP